MKHCMPRYAALVALGCSLVSSALFAEDAPKKPWSNSAEASFLGTNGNTKTTTTGIKNDFSYKWPKYQLDLNAGGLGSSNKDKVTAERYFAGQKLAYNITERFYGFERFHWDKDRFAGIRSRYETTGGLGYKFLNLPSHEWLTEVGSGYIWEERTIHTKNNFASGRAYTKYTYKISESSKFSQDFEYLHDYEDSDNFRMNTESALIASLTNHLALKTSFKWNKVAKPPVGFVKNDTTTAVALVVNY